MTYDKIITSSSVVLVEFYATWCPHCQAMTPAVAQIKELLEGKADVYQLDVDKNEELCDREQINSTPTFIIYKNGHQVWRESGEMDSQALLSKVQSYL